MGKRPRIKAAKVPHKPAGIYIDHPDSDPVSSNFAAFGRADRVCQVLGLLTDSSGKVLAVGHTLAPAPNWVIYFHGLQLNTSYTLWVFEVPTRDGSCTCFQSASQDFSTAKGQFDQVTIDYPHSGVTVPKSFSAYGTTDQSGTVTGDLDGPGNFAGTVLQGPPDWVVQFSAPATHPYTLGVQIGNAFGVAMQLTLQ